MSTPLFQYNGYAFPPGVRPASLMRSGDAGEQELPRRAGSSVQPVRLKSRTLKLAGAIINVSPDALQATFDAMLAACLAGTRLPLPLYFGRSDRYVNAQLLDCNDDYQMGEQSGIGYFVKVDLSFLAGDPFWYAASGPVIAALSASAATVVTPGGVPQSTAGAAPVWSITVGTAGTGTISLTNSTTLETATITGTFNQGDVIALDWLNANVTVNGVANYALLSGVIPRLPQGANSISVSGSGVSVSSASVAYTPRYL